MPASVLIDVDGVERTTHRLLRLSARADNAEPALAAIGRMLRESEAERFDTEGNGEWAALAPSTLARKQAAGLDPRILRAEGDLHASLTELGGDHFEIIQRDELIFGTSDPKARFHQDGTERMPARPPVAVDAATQREIVREIQRYVIGGDEVVNAALAGVL